MRRLVTWMALFFSIYAQAQLDVSGGFEQDTVVIGDEVSFTLSVMTENDIEVIGVTTYFLDSIYGSLQSIKAQKDTSEPLVPVLADFEVIDFNGWEDLDQNGIFTPDEVQWTISDSGSEQLYQSTFTIRVWDPGFTVIPYPVVIYRQGQTQDQFVKEGQMSVFVAPPGGLAAQKDSLEIAPIKTIVEEPVHFSDYLVYFIIILVALFGGIIYWWYTKYQKARTERIIEVEEKEIYVPPHEKAFGKLTALKDKELWQRGEIKKYQSELTYIIREYLEGRYQIAALESTTDEIVKNLLEELSDDGDVISLKRILQVADLVKFAKARPDQNIHETFMDEAMSFVERTKFIEEQEPEDD